MSRENDALHTLAESILDAFNRHDVPALLGFFHRDAVLEEHSDFVPDPGTYRGWPEISAYWESYDRAWDDFHIETEELRFIGSKIFAVTRFIARGKLSGASIETPIILVGTVHRAKLIHLDLHLDRQAALEAVGLSE